MCTRVTYLGPDELVITARSMDWFEDMQHRPVGVPQGDGARRRSRLALGALDQQVR